MAVTLPSKCPIHLHRSHSKPCRNGSSKSIDFVPCRVVTGRYPPSRAFNDLGLAVLILAKTVPILQEHRAYASTTIEWPCWLRVAIRAKHQRTQTGSDMGLILKMAQQSISKSIYVCQCVHFWFPTVRPFQLNYGNHTSPISLAIRFNNLPPSATDSYFLICI